MARESITRGPNFVHPEKPSAVGSRNSVNRDNRDEYKEAKHIIDEEVDKILNHIHAKLPPEVLEKLDVMGSVKSKLHNYFNQDFQNMLNRYIVTMEDEMSKKFRDLVDREESKVLNRYTPKEITDIIDKVTGIGTLNTGEIEKSVVNMYGQMQSHIQRGMSEIEDHTNALLKEKSDVGAFIRGENSYAIAKCSFRDNPRRAKNVMDMKLSISIHNSELISSIYHYEVPVGSLIKDVVAKHIQRLIDKEIAETNKRLDEEGKDSLNDTGRLFEKFRIMDKYVSDDESEESTRYQYVAKKFLDAVDSIEGSIDSEDYDALNIRENIAKIIDSQNIRNRGFNSAVNAITSILDTSKMGYQFIENFKNARECLIREYEEEDPAKLPDERYAIRLVYYDQEQLNSLRESYQHQLKELTGEVMHLWEVCNGIHQESLEASGKDDWSTLAAKMLSEASDAKGGDDAAATESEGGQWNEINFIQPELTKVSEENPTCEIELEELGARFPLMLEKMEKAFGKETSEIRRVFENRLRFVREQYETFANQINPYHIQPGLLLDIDIVSIKKKKTTMLNMSNVINEFLYSVSKGFSETEYTPYTSEKDVTIDPSQVFMTVD